MICQLIFFTSLVPFLPSLKIINQPTKTRPTQLVVVRTYNPHEGMIHRMQLYLADIKKNMPDSRFLVSVDITNMNKAGMLKQHLPEAEIHIYNQSSVAEVYRNVPIDAWSYHMEPLNLAAKYAIDRFGTAFDYIWMVEDDVIICGLITDLMSLYASNNADLIGSGHGHGELPTKGKRTWPHLNEGSHNFLKRYPVDKRFFGAEQVLRFSATFLDHLHELAYAESVSAWSEMFPYTVALNDNYKLASWQLELYGKYCWNCVISKEDAQEMCAKVEQEGRITINHAGKFSKGYGWKGMLLHE